MPVFKAIVTYATVAAIIAVFSSLLYFATLLPDGFTNAAIPG